MGLGVWNAYFAMLWVRTVEMTVLLAACGFTVEFRWKVGFVNCHGHVHEIYASCRVTLRELHIILKDVEITNKR